MTLPSERPPRRRPQVRPAGGPPLGSFTVVAHKLRAERTCKPGLPAAAMPPTAIAARRPALLPATVGPGRPWGGAKRPPQHGH
eukprot:13053821-Alexandrium_andersonii.AAC.1